MKLAITLASKNMSLLDMLKILNPKDGSTMYKKEFMRRLKLFDPSLTTKQIEMIAEKFSKDDNIAYELVK